MNDVNRTPAIVGFLIAGAIILALGFMVGRSDGANDLDGVPELSIRSPQPGDTLANPVAVEFVTPAPLELGPAGWVARDMHLHIMVDDTELMPAAADIRPAGAGFIWTLPPLETGDRRVYLTWAGRHHGNLRGHTDTIQLHITH
ncbi:hypothetical protein BH23GEM10_BH23GEM10_04070 [soil metagenome]